MKTFVALITYIALLVGVVDARLLGQKEKKEKLEEVCAFSCLARSLSVSQSNSRAHICKLCCALSLLVSAAFSACLHWCWPRRVPWQERNEALHLARRENVMYCGRGCAWSFKEQPWRLLRRMRSKLLNLIFFPAFFVGPCSHNQYVTFTLQLKYHRSPTSEKSVVVSTLHSVMI